MTKENKKIFGILATLVFHGLIIVILMMLAFKPSPPPYPDPDGILINFGDETEGAGVPEPEMTKNEPQPETQQTEKPENLTQDYEEAPAVEQPKKENKPQKEKKTPEEKPKDKPKEPEKPKIDQNSLFPSNYKSNSSSQGNALGKGNKGSKEGDVTGTGNVDLGKGIKGITYSLKGRSAIRLTPPKYPPKNVEGKVKLKIIVDSNGNVISASLAPGSTASDPDLIKAAITAAYKTKFNKDTYTIKQQGYITYEFKLR
jgi:TonB family protein